MGRCRPCFFVWCNDMETGSQKIASQLLERLPRGPLHAIVTTQNLGFPPCLPGLDPIKVVDIACHGHWVLIVDHDLDGRGKVVVHAGAGEKPPLKRIPDAGQLGDGHSVRELDMVEP